MATGSMLRAFLKKKKSGAKKLGKKWTGKAVSNKDVEGMLKGTKKAGEGAKALTSGEAVDALARLMKKRKKKSKITKMLKK